MNAINPIADFTFPSVDTLVNRAIFDVAHHHARLSPLPTYRDAFKAALAATHAAFDQFEALYGVDPYDCEYQELAWLLSEALG